MKTLRWLSPVALVIGLSLAGWSQQSDQGSNAIININVSRTI